jgi:tRNA(Ile2) C34 agmatinyltransferase TiaS
MASNSNAGGGRGATALERLRDRLDAREPRCPECGAADGGRWRVHKAGGRVIYRRLCPHCGAIARRTIRHTGDEEDVDESNPEA